MVPILGALILQAAYGAVDLLVVGRFGSTSGLSAVSTGSQVLNLVTFVVTQLVMGITVLIARYLGEKKPDRIAPLLGGGAVVFAIISVGLCIGSGMFGPSHFCADAGSQRVTGSDGQLCADLRMRHLLHCGLQPAFGHLPWSGGQ